MHSTHLSAASNSLDGSSGRRQRDGMDQRERGDRFRALHERSSPLLLPNPWDPGTARLLAQLGFEALASTSLGVAAVRGKTRASAGEILENLRELCAATTLPVNADLENCYADDPREAAGMLARAHACGAVGGSIEDATARSSQPIYELGHAVERVHAAVEQARALPTPFVLTARAEGLLYGVGDLDEIIRRLQAFEAAGADVLYAPGLRTAEQIRTVVSAVTRPVNVVMGFADPTLTLERLSELGVRRVSIGGGLARVALRAFLDAAGEMRAGRFEFVRRMAGVREIFDAFPSEPSV
jgi:2-methylisocitrate lyase-like PEP mutase family enzyme